MPSRTVRPLPKTRKTKDRRGLSKSSSRSRRNASAVTRRQIKQTIMSLATPKFFKTTQQMKNQYPSPIRTGAAMYCWGFSTGPNPVANTRDTATAQMNYGMGALNPLNHGKVSLEHNGGSTNAQDLIAMRPDGCEVRPLWAKTTITLERTNVNLNASNPRELNPMLIRCIRVRVKEVRNGMNSIYPNKDLFVDNWNRETGVGIASFDKQSMIHFSANSDKYKVLDDFQFQLDCPIMYTGETLVPTMLNQQEAGVVNFSRGAGKSFKTLTFTHDLGAKLGYDLKNDVANQEAQPDKGMNQEYILFHMQYIGDDPAETLAGQENSADKIRFTTTPVSCFVDI